MKPFAALLALLIAGSAETQHELYQRPLQNTPPSPLQTCVTIDATIFSHSASALGDLRLRSGDAEVPYVVRTSPPEEKAEGNIQPLNLGTREGKATFDAAMPEGRYSDIELSIEGQDFIATVEVFGSHVQSGGSETRLGAYTIFDLTGQKLGRSTVLHLPESDFRYLHFRVGSPIKPEQVKGLSVDRVPERLQRFVIVSDTYKTEQKAHQTEITFTVPANVPVDHVEFLPGTQPANFSRAVTVSIAPASHLREDGEEREPVSFGGHLLRVHGVHNGHRIDEEDLDLEAPQQAQPQQAQEQDTLWTLTIDNGDDAPLKLNGVRLEMEERKLCFDAKPGAAYTLFYGDPKLAAPRYDYATLFEPEKDAASAGLGPEQKNPDWQPRPDERPFSEKYPALLWGALLLVIVLLGVLALRASKKEAAKKV